jgi:hypothetical protein
LEQVVTEGERGLVGPHKGLTSHQGISRRDSDRERGLLLRTYRRKILQECYKLPRIDSAVEVSQQSLGDVALMAKTINQGGTVKTIRGGTIV